MENVLDPTGLVWRKWHQLNDILRVSLDSTLPSGTEPEYLQVMDVVAPEYYHPFTFTRAKELGLLSVPDDMVYRAKTVENKIRPEVAQQFGLKSNGQETVDRHYHPRLGVEKGKVSFKVHIVKENPEDKMPFKRITLWKRGVAREIRADLLFGRANENVAFGFRNPMNPYLTLAYPGLTGVFEPLFVKVSEVTGRQLDVYYLKVSAKDGLDNTVVVEAMEVDSKEVPAFLKKA